MLHLPSLILYCCVSIFMVFGNKYLLNVWRFDCILLLVLTENLTNYTLTSLILYYKSSGTSPSANKHSNSNANFGYELLSATFYCLNSILSLKALSGLNIPIYTIFKRCVPLASLVLSFFLFPKRGESLETGSGGTSTAKTHSKRIVLSICCMTLGVSIFDLFFALSKRKQFGYVKFDLIQYKFGSFCQVVYPNGFEAFFAHFSHLI
jgi:hypothetical protein